MKSRERLLNTLNLAPVDRVAVAPFVYTNAVREWRGTGDIDPIRDTIAFCDAFGFDIILRNFGIRNDDLGVETDSWRVEKAESFEGEKNRLVSSTVHTPKGQLRQVVVHTKLSPNLNVTSIREHLIKETEDFDLLAAYLPAPKVDLSALRAAKQAIGEKGILAPWSSGVFNYMSDLRSLEDLLTDPYMDDGFYETFAAFCQARLQAAISPVLEEGIDMISYAGNIASASMVGPKYFDANVLPFEKKHVDHIQASCLGIIYHNCGDAQALIPCYNQLSPRCFETMTEPPYASNELSAFLQGMDERITLMGNIDQIDFLRAAMPEQVFLRARDVLEKARCRKGFILGTSDFLEEGTPAENLHALAKAVLP